jgi:peptidoglycan hydrolase-like amidase
MLKREPTLSVGILEGYENLRGQLDGTFVLNDGRRMDGPFTCTAGDRTLHITLSSGETVADLPDVTFSPVAPDASFLLDDVTIGVTFHWERKEQQRFRGALRIVLRPGKGLTAINAVPLEEYLASVISSEMSASAPAELLRAHAITSRSWLVAMLERGRHVHAPQQPVEPITSATTEVIRWYSREDHDIFDVCADDHCQRYQGITKIISSAAAEAVASTRGVFLVHDNTVCDARYYKACGGLTDNFPSSWEETDIPYLRSIADAPVQHPPIRSEGEMERWVLSSPEAYCNTRDPAILRQILPSFDQETTDFYRWRVSYTREELEGLLRKKADVNVGTLMDLVPLQRGPSGRLVRLRIVGTQRALTVGKDLEIRRWLSPSHLYSSAFIVRTERRDDGVPLRFTLYGAGWGHGVGLCQIGAAVMAVRGFTAEEIVRHYFRGAELRKVY